MVSRRFGPAPAGEAMMLWAHRHWPDFNADDLRATLNAFYVMVASVLLLAIVALGFLVACSIYIAAELSDVASRTLLGGV